ncbi:MAG TPA: hypothetical protein VMZ69_09345 [Saprospiraceae bacterium]|nr:hypothetical protein [Saprospiraceae bacterium]
MNRLTIILLISCLGCTKKNTLPDLEAEKESLMLLQNEQRQAHMEKNVELLLDEDYDDYLEVNRGFVRKPTRAESTKRFQSYFDAVDFIKWDDVAPPVFSFSDDGTMATSVVDKIVITKLKEEGNRLDTAHFAWLVVYKKENDKWHMHRMGSTNR